MWPSCGGTISESRRAELALAGITLIWGVSFTLVKGALDHAPPFEFLAIRFALATAILIVIPRPPGRYPVREGLAAGVLLAVSYFLQTFGLHYTTPAKSAFLTSLSVVLVPLASMLVYRNRPGAFEASGIGIAIVGMGLLTLPPGGLSLGTLNRGDLLTAGCAATFAGHILAVGHWAPRVEPVPFILLQTATVTGLSLLAMGSEQPVQWTARLLVAILVTGALCTVVAYLVQTWAQKRTSATRTAMIFALEPVAAAVTSYLVAGELFTPRAACGAFLILAGIFSVELKHLRRAEHLRE
ncbi:MAG: DMT family transporter [Acidobacteria bacterium]|nr:DMT family transporter [Acidobacteriota bacterium]